MRKELFRWWSITVAVVAVPLGIFMMGTLIWLFLNDNTLSGRIAAGVGTAIVASWTTFVAATPWLRRRSKMRPLIIIDDAGLWLRSVGELMPWSEIQSVEWKNDGRYINIIVAWRHERYRVEGWMMMDGDGKHWGPRRIYKEVRACWEQNRHPSSVSAASDQAALPGT
jgi:hypothetical protein